MCHTALRIYQASYTLPLSLCSWIRHTPTIFIILRLSLKFPCLVAPCAHLTYLGCSNATNSSFGVLSYNKWKDRVQWGREGNTLSVLCKVKREIIDPVFGDDTLLLDEDDPEVESSIQWERFLQSISNTGERGYLASLPSSW